VVLAARGALADGLVRPAQVRSAPHRAALTAPNTSPRYALPSRWPEASPPMAWLRAWEANPSGCTAGGGPTRPVTLCSAFTTPARTPWPPRR